jgi:membrane-associated phospholipid phosphatase
MLAACLLLLVLAAIGAWRFPDPLWKTLAGVGAVMMPISLLPAIVLHDCSKFERRDAALTIPWSLVMALLIPPIAVLSGRLHFPLVDSLFIKTDRLFGVSVPEVVAWCASHPRIDELFDRSYHLLFWILPTAILVPALAGKREAAERFLVANVIAFFVALPLFTVWPAVGPWYGFGFEGNALQKACEASIVALHGGGVEGAVGVVCFPSFHVIWAMLAAAALWSVKPLRIIAAIAAGLIAISTVTTGWHYITDVAGGLAVAALSFVLAGGILKRIN